MYGTVARFRLKPGMEAELIKLNQEYQGLQIPGMRAEYIYRMDANPNEYYMVVLFESREAYHSNAASPEQDERYRKFRALLEGDPEWHDGEVVHAMA